MWHTERMETEQRPTIWISPYAAFLPRAEVLEEQTAVLKALAEPMRLSILAIIAAANGEAVCACEFPDALGISQPTASHHLKRLTDVGLLHREQRGKWAWFSLVPEKVRSVQDFLETLR